ncbi:MAG: sigma-54-dependent Fis family transcriptional regulator [Vagococcus sp.]|uniref:sigma-54-dependent Fis family transcriptional regulator n=1 Tax=Vagococcus sp. TaxID=1933889 RepID=UPI002FC63C65
MKLLNTKELWHTYVQSNKVDQDLLPQHIVESWEYCMSHGVNPFSTQGIDKVSNTTLQTQKKQWAYLISIVKDEIRRLNEFFYIKKPLFILTDNKGVVIWREGHEETRHLANDIHFSEGSIWTEKAVGTNAIGIALRTMQSVTVERFQHFAEASHPFTCTSTPILDGNEEVIACLNVSTSEKLSEANYTLFALKMIAKNVQQKIAEKQLAEQKERILESLNEPLEKSLLVGLDGKVLSASRDFKENFAQCEGQSVDEILRQKNYHFIKKKLYEQDQLIGFCYQLEVKKSEPSFVSFGITSQNAKYQQFLNQLSQAAKSELPIHIYGETGSGKEVSAKTIHYNSSRQSEKLIAVNCGALSENLLESELFGYASGAFTGASMSGYKGKILQADKGTLFLDEIDSMSKRMQVALLRALEDKKITPLGGEKEIPVDFRLVTASNRELKKLVEKNEFREDLFYRLYVIPLELPPLRQRQEDFETFVSAFCQKKEWYPKWQSKISELAKEFEWQGNIREFHNFLERLHLYFPTKEPSQEEVVNLIEIGAIKIKRITDGSLDERVLIINTLKATNYHLSQSAEKLNMARSTLYRKIDKYQIDIKR